MLSIPSMSSFHCDSYVCIGHACCAFDPPSCLVIESNALTVYTDLDLVNSHLNFPWFQVWDGHSTSVSCKLRCEKMLMV